MLSRQTRKKVFVDGQQGTTGLRIVERLAERPDVELIRLADAARKDSGARKAALNAADFVFLCLPDAAAVEAVGWIDNPDTVVIDASTAHRTHPDWVYGLPELSAAQAAAVPKAKRIAVPGCHAAGFILLVAPLIQAGFLAPEAPLTFFSLTGYSGGGKPMIAAYEERPPAGAADPLAAPRQYALGQTHKHLKEIVGATGLAEPPVFCPVVGDFYAGMEVTVPLPARLLQGGADIEAIRHLYRRRYAGPVVRYEDSLDSAGFVSANRFAGKDGMAISVAGNSDRMLLVALYDNLGKGASGAALECMNLSLGLAAAHRLVL